MADMRIAKTIADQIGRRAFFMVGAKNLVGHENGLSFKIMRNAKSVTHIKVTLDPDDTYTVEFANFNMNRKKTPQYKVLDTVEGVYCDMLHNVLSNRTGLALSMNVRGI